ncbi:Inositol 1,4,5-trisphosphate receptor type 2 [Lamellibrachia satsuma]|nr:Inositol 1,4,5-trisphosphate receptor type 2 [Lamellibrachia satsuma]
MESKELVQLVEQSMDEEEMDYHDDGYIELVLRMMGSMCDGQNTTLQDYLREQPDNIKSVNLIAETTQFLSLIYGSVNNKNIILITELFTTLVEFTVGNNENKLVVFDHKVCDYINCILRRGHFHQCDDHEILALKQSIATLIVALTEEDFNIAGLGAKEIGETIDGDTVWQIAKECYQRVNCEEGQKLSTEMVKETEELGYKFYHILCRLRQIDTTDRNSLDRLLKTSDDRDVWDHYDEGTLSIEIVKDDNIQKIHFRCKDKSVLREDVKEKFKYAVDRSSPSNKLRDLMDWSEDITQDISYTRRVLKNPLARFFVKYWWHFNIGMIFMSFVFFVLTMVTWRSPSDLTRLVPVFVYPDIVRICTWVLGGIHNACAMCALISFFITNHPTLPRLKPLRRLCQYVRSPRDVDSRDGDQVEDRTSNLEVKFFSFKTFWYLLLGAFSILGTIFYGYFFSFHLLHIAEFNQLLHRTIRAITQNGVSLMWVFIYGLIIIYIYALFGFAFYRELFDAQTGLYCTTLYECSVTMLHRGFILGILEFLSVPDGKPFIYHLFKGIFDLTFFVVITTIGLNIIFGIIVDTFSELRDNKWQVESDMHNTCFICSRSSYDFEHHGSVSHCSVLVFNAHFSLAYSPKLF